MIQEVREFAINETPFSLSDQINDAIKTLNKEGHKVTGFYMGPETIFLLYEKAPERSISVTKASEDDMEFFFRMMKEKGTEVMKLFDGPFITHADNVKIEIDRNHIKIDGRAIHAIADIIGFP